MVRCVIVAAALLLSAGTALAHGRDSSAPPPNQDTAALPVLVSQTKKGAVLADPKGMTLYYFDRDDSGNKSNCDGKCAEKWIPLPAGKDARPVGDFTVVTRSDGSKMWAYRYRPLYTSHEDKAPGDTNGFDTQNLWHIARPVN